AVLLDFENYGKIHRPYFQRSRLLARKGNDCRVQLRVYRRKFFVSMVADADLEVHTTMLDSGRAVLRMQALRIQEIDDAGESGERPSEPGNERGFLWRYVSYYRVAQSKDGAYLQAEAISLSKGIFFPMGTFLRGVHKDSLEDIVRNTKDELIARKKGR
ncbi:MAG: hypothetical protein ACRD44_15465, partial [Bryobacteraceae bacterium]